MGLVRRGEVNVNASEQGKHERLHQDHQATEQHHGQGYEYRQEAQENSQDQVIHSHVEHQAHGQSHGPHAQGNDFDGENQGSQVPDRSGEVLDVAHSLLFEPVDVEEEEHHQGAAERDVETARGHRHSGNEGQNVGEEDEERGASDEGKVFLGPFGVHDALGHLVEVLKEDFRESAQGELLLRDQAGLSLDLAADRAREQDHKQHDQAGRSERFPRLPRGCFTLHNRVAQVMGILLEHVFHMRENQGEEVGVFRHVSGGRHSDVEGTEGSESEGDGVSGKDGARVPERRIPEGRAENPTAKKRGST